MPRASKTKRATKARSRKTTPLERAVEWAGSTAGLAAQLECHQSTVELWRRNRRVPPNRAKLIALLCEGLVSAEELSKGW